MKCLLSQIKTWLSANLKYYKYQGQTRICVCKDKLFATMNN